MSARALTKAFRPVSQSTSIAQRNVFRSYATAANEAKPPVALFGVDGTYASALYTAAVKTSTLDPTAKALDSLHRTFVSDAKLPTILSAPTLSDGDKQQLIDELIKVSGAPSTDKTFRNFLETLSANHRMGVLPGVCEKFAALMSAHRGEIEMTVTSAAPLDQKMVKQLETAVSKSQYVGQGKKLKVVTKVQPNIRGGLIVEIGDRTIDLSVASKMSRMNQLLQESL